jgi:predicted ATPase
MEVVPLFAALLSLPLPADYAPLTMSPEQQKQQTLHALLTILLRIAAQQPVLFVMEDLHWVDPSTPPSPHCAAACDTAEGWREVLHIGVSA